MQLLTQLKSKIGWEKALNYLPWLLMAAALVLGSLVDWEWKSWWYSTALTILAFYFMRSKLEDNVDRDWYLGAIVLLFIAMGGIRILAGIVE